MLNSLSLAGDAPPQPDVWLRAADLLDPPGDPYAEDPVGFAQDRLGFTAWSKQREIMLSLRDHARTAVRACHGPGKTAVAAQIILWFLAAHPGNSRVITTAPTWAQVADLLWRELRASVARAHAMGELLTWPAASATKLELGEQWFAIGHSTDRPERFQGHHADHLLLVVDEASGVDEAIFEAAEGFLTAAGARILLLGNPTRTGGTFHRAFTTERANWSTVHISAYDCPNETGEPVPENVARALPRKGWAAERLAAWGEDSPIYQVRVAGNFPSKGVDTVIALGDVEDAQARELPVDDSKPAIISCDIARYGCHDDQTEILTDHGWLYFDDLTGSEMVLSRHEDGTAAWEPITEVHRYRHTGPMVLYNGERLNFCVTENHRMLAASAHHGRVTYLAPPRYLLRRWDECPGEFIAPRQVDWQGTDPGVLSFVSSVRMPHGGERRKTWTFDPADWFALLGWFISEGNVYREARAGGRKRVLIAQSGGGHMPAIRALLTRMGIRHRLTPAGTQVEFSIRVIADHLDAECGHGAAAKRIPRYVLDAPPRLMEAFLDAYCDGDGTRRAGRRQSYVTTSPQIADGLQEMFVKLGRAGTLSVAQMAGSVATIEGRPITRRFDTLVVTEQGRIRHATINKSRAHMVEYDGYVHCVTTPHHTIMTRRNGCTIWAGNSDETVICERVGQCIRIVERYFGKPTTHTAARVAHWASQHVVARIVVDDTGVGGGVTDQLRADGWQVTPFNAANAAFSPLEFPNRRSELWFQLAEQLPDLDLDGDEQLCADLVTPKYTYDLKMRRVVESKDAMRSRIGRSPDRGDAVMLTLVPEQAHGSIALPAARKPQDADRLSAEDLRRMPM